MCNGGPLLSLFLFSVIFDVVPYKRVISNLEGNFERFHNYGLIPSLLKFSDLHTVLIVVNTLMVTFK
jgi:hypothetical protein